MCSGTLGKKYGCGISLTFESNLRKQGAYDLLSAGRYSKSHDKIQLRTYTWNRCICERISSRKKCTPCPTPLIFPPGLLLLAHIFTGAMSRQQLDVLVFAATFQHSVVYALLPLLIRVLRLPSCLPFSVQPPSFLGGIFVLVHLTPPLVTLTEGAKSQNCHNDDNNNN